MIKKYSVTSETDKQTKYIVIHFSATGKFVCNCPAYGFGKVGYECKHIKKVKEFLEAQNEKQHA